ADHALEEVPILDLCLDVRQLVLAPRALVFGDDLPLELVVDARTLLHEEPGARHVERAHEPHSDRRDAGHEQNGQQNEEAPAPNDAQVLAEIQASVVRFEFAAGRSARHTASLQAKRKMRQGSPERPEPPRTPWTARTTPGRARPSPGG